MTTLILRPMTNLSSRPVEVVLGILISLLSMWMVAFQWFSNYFQNLKDYAGLEWMVGIPLMLYGICQVVVSVANWRTGRVLLAMSSGLIFFLFTSASIYENGWVGPHVPGFGLCIACHLWAWFKLTGLLPGEHE
jgi:hypothetical protein